MHGYESSMMLKKITTMPDRKQEVFLEIEPQANLARELMVDLLVCGTAA
jgi:hypothetical protein